jgi:hypothetical protein
MKKKTSSITNSSLKRLVERIFTEKKLTQKDQTDLNLFAKVAFGQDEAELVNQLHEKISRGEIKVI